ncbi:DUF4190 domain-containing protein [Microbacterium sp. W4I20]|uniref:DUF4190 domain-containing protein n=1 Tax=Microbacterium sp. W4I20 TaxID=3042262 RepID=UPI00278AC31A|nr:DUF4190 domain-containing protein [Microbacterium sp. W4I20]MDQ0725289.1 hypothetical protein [Microbacterium sp. W4I20]
MSDDTRIPSPPDAQRLTPPPPPPPAATLSPAYAPTYPAQVPPQPTQAYPGATPGYGQVAPQQQPYGQAAIQQSPYGVAPAQSGYGPPLPPQQQGYSPYAASGYPAPPARPTSGLAVTSLVCGIAGIVLFWAVVPMLASIAAVITGHMALRQTKRDPGLGGRGMAFAGVIMGYVVAGILLFSIISTIVGLLFFGAFTLPFLYAS